MDVQDRYLILLMRGLNMQVIISIKHFSKPVSQTSETDPNPHSGDLHRIAIHT